MSRLSGTDLLSVYRAVRAVGHGRRRALRCVFAVRRGSWVARDVGEMRAQLALVASRLSRKFVPPVGWLSEDEWCRLPEPEMDLYEATDESTRWWRPRTTAGSLAEPRAGQDEARQARQNEAGDVRCPDVVAEEGRDA